MSDKDEKIEEEVEVASTQEAPVNPPPNKERG